MRQSSVSAAAVVLIGGALAFSVAPATAQTPAPQTPAAQPPAPQTPAPQTPAAQTPADQVPKIEVDTQSAAPAPKAARRHARTHRRVVRVRPSYYYALGYNRPYVFGFRRAYLGAYQGGPFYSAAYYGTSGYDGARYDAAYNGTGLIRDLPYGYRRRLLAGVSR
jgi:hypothetical protein